MGSIPFRQRALHPGAAVLGVGPIRGLPVEGDAADARQCTVWLSLSYDARRIDDESATRFLQQVAREIEEPYRLLA